MIYKLTYEYIYYLSILWSLILLKCFSVSVFSFINISATRTTNVQNLMHGEYDLNRHKKQDHGVVFYFLFILVYYFI